MIRGQHVGSLQIVQIVNFASAEPVLFAREGGAMELLKNQFARLQQQLSSLSASQKMLAATLVAIMVMTLVWWGKYAGQSEMEPVLEQDFTPEEITRVTADIASKGIQYSVSGTRVLVPSDKKFEVLAALSFGGLLPHDTQNGIEEMINKNSSPFDDQKTQEDRRIKAKAATLQLVLRNFPHVQNAVVVLDTSSQRGIGGSGNIQPTASVMLEMKSGQRADRKLVNSAADWVAGAVANLERTRVRVIVDGATWLIHDDGEGSEGGDGDFIAKIQEGERHFARKIQDHFFFIEGLAVSVAVQPSDRLENGEQTIYDPKNTVQQELRTESSNEETSVPAAGAGVKDPGAVANVSISTATPPAAGGEAATTTHETVKTDYVPLAGVKNVHYRLLSNLQVVSASVRVPRSYFVRILKAAKPDKDPDEATVAALIDRELPKIRSDVKACANLKSDADVVVDTYMDLLPLASASTATAASTVSVVVGSHGKEIVLGALAVISLFMVSMMAKKGGSTAPLTESIVINADGPVAGPVSVPKAPSKAKAIKTSEELEEVGEGSAALDGVELDPDSIRNKQMLEQVANLVKENPDAAAGLVKRWLNRT